eukprot:IDg7247t1
MTKHSLVQCSKLANIAFHRTSYTTTMGKGSPEMPKRILCWPGLSCTSHFLDISADFQKFWRAVTTVNNASPTGTTEEDYISMAIAIHIGKMAWSTLASQVLDVLEAYGYEYGLTNVLEAYV